MNEGLDPMRALYGAQPVQPTAGQNAKKAAEAEDGKSFADVMKDYVKQVDEAQHKFDDAIEAVERGETDNLHQVMLAQNEAQLSLRMAAEVRNKLIDAYREASRTQF